MSDVIPRPLDRDYLTWRAHYRGPGGLFLDHILVLTLILALVWAVRLKVATVPVAERMGLWWFVFAFLLLPLHWVEISADKGTLTVRKHFFGKRKVVPFSNIKQAKIIEQQQIRYGRAMTKGRKTRFLAVTVRSGQSFDLYLSKPKLAGLAAFIRRRIAA